MKKLTILLCLIASVGFAQIDSNRIYKLEQGQKEIKLKLSAFHKEYRTGTEILFSGLLFSGAGLLVQNQRHENSSQFLFILGSSLSTIGMVVHLDSHKHLK